MVPSPKIFEAGEYLKNVADDLMHFKSLKISSKRSILKSLNMEVIVLHNFKFLIILLHLNTYNKYIYNNFIFFLSFYISLSYLKTRLSSLLEGQQKKKKKVYFEKHFITILNS